MKGDKYRAIEGLRKALAETVRRHPQVETFFPAAEQFAGRDDEIAAGGFAPPKIRELTTAAVAEVADLTAHVKATLLETREPEFKQREGELRAAGRGETSIPAYETSADTTRRIVEGMAATQRAVEMNADLHLIASTDDAGAIAEIIDDAFLADHTRTIRRVARSAALRLAALERAEYATHRNEQGFVSPAGRALRELRDRVAAWEVDHPRPAQQLAALARERSEYRGAIERAHALIAETLGFDDKSRLMRGERLGAPAAPAPGDMVIGRGFSR